MYKQIFIILVLISLSIGIYILIEKDKNRYRDRIETIKIPEITIPKKSIRFKIIKNQNNQINFRGIFSDKNTPIEIINFLNQYSIIDNIKIDKSRKTNRNILIFIKKILKKLDNSFLQWTIVYKDKKLLISGKTTDIKSKNSIDNLIKLSTLDCFSDIEIIQIEDNPLEIISNLKSIIEDEEIESVNSITPTDDEIEDIILALKKIKPKRFIKNKEIKKEIQKSKKEMKRKIRERTKIKKKNLFLRKNKKIIEKKKQKIEPATIIPISYSEYKSLPDIQPIDNIKEFDKKLKGKNMKIIDEGTIYIDSPP